MSDLGKAGRLPHEDIPELLERIRVGRESAIEEDGEWSDMQVAYDVLWALADMGYDVAKRKAATAANMGACRAGLQYMLSQIIVPRGAQVAQEGDHWVAYLEGLPLATEEPTFDEAIDELMRAMREYAADWQERLYAAPNHKDNWGLVQFIELSSDNQLREWLLAFDE